jgi:hypothetical protein
MTDTDSVHHRVLNIKDELASRIKAPLSEIAAMCSEVWPDADELDDILSHEIGTLQDCSLMYAWNVEGLEVSSMVQIDNLDPKWRGQDLTDRPYLTNHLPYKGIMLSSVYRSAYDGRECITALQAVNRDHQLLGFIAADFSLSDLLRGASLESSRPRWRQYRGDPAVRGTLFMQERAPSELDAHIDEVLDHFMTLFAEHGIFHAKLHFASGRCSIWLIDDPYSYRILTLDEILDPDLSLAYPWRPYTDKATVSLEQIRQCLDQFKGLRFADETIYLRSASINIINGMIGLTFSCDGSHYMPIGEFLERDMAFWLGATGS